MIFKVLAANPTIKKTHRKSQTKHICGLDSVLNCHFQIPGLVIWGQLPPGGETACPDGAVDLARLVQTCLSGKDDIALLQV